MPHQTEQALAEKSIRIRKKLVEKSAELKPDAVRALTKRAKRADRRIRRMKDTQTRQAKKVAKKEAAG
jgi:hypothetical protein